MLFADDGPTVPVGSGHVPPLTLTPPPLAGTDREQWIPGFAAAAGGEDGRHPHDVPLPFAALHPDVACEEEACPDSRGALHVCKGLFSMFRIFVFASCCLLPKVLYRRITNNRRCDEWTLREEIGVELLRHMLHARLDAARAQIRLIERLLHLLPAPVSVKTVRIPDADCPAVSTRPLLEGRPPSGGGLRVRNAGRTSRKAVAHWIGCDPPTERAWLREKEAGVDPGLVLLYFHGGGYTIGSSRLMTLAFVSILKALNRRHPGVRVRICAFDYPLAPEAAFPSAIDSALTAYRWLLRQPGIPDARVALGGDSAGGGLALALMQKLRLSDRSSPAAAAAPPLRSRISGAALLSPWVNASLAAGGSVARNGATDVIRASAARQMVRFYLTGSAVGPEADAYLARYSAHPMVSALRADLTGFPAMYVSGGSRELFYDDLVAFADKARAAGVDVETDFAEHMVHVYTHLEPFLGMRATRGVQKLADFLAKIAARPLDPKESSIVDIMFLEE